MNLLVLDTTAISIEAVLSGAPATTQPDYTSHYATVDATTFTEGEKDGTLNGTTAVTIVAAPSAGFRKIIREIIIFNKDTASVTLTLRMNNGGTFRTIWSGSLAVGASFRLSDGAIATGGVTVHSALTGLSADDHTQYLLATGLREWSEQGSDPSTPAVNKWKLYFKAGGLYIIDDAGAVTGALGTGGGSGGDLYNYLINGGFDFAQRQTPGTLTTIADKEWGADRWQQFAENASWQYNRNDATGESGLTSQYYGLFKKITSTGKGIFVQKVEGNNSIPLRSKTVIFQIKMKASASKTIKIAVLELQTAGTVDTFPAAIASAFGANTVDPTWGSNVAVVTGAQSCAVTTSWQSFTASVTIPSNSKNVVVAMWTDSQFAANDTLSVAEAGFFVASSVQAWKPRHLAEELVLASRYFELISSEDNGSMAYGVAQTASTTRALNSISWKVKKRIAPTVTLSATGDWAFYDAAILSYKPWTSVNPNTDTYGIILDATCSGGGLPAAGGATLMTANAATTAARIYVNAEIP